MFILQETPIDITGLKSARADDNDGALVSFEGIVRADEYHGKACPPELNAKAFEHRRVSVLEYMADVAACNTEGQKIVAETLSLFPVTHAVCVQRVGKINVGEAAIWIGVWASHRDEAFKANRHIIEEVKKRLLIWKKEFFADGSSEWVRGCQHEVKI